MSVDARPGDVLASAPPDIALDEAVGIAARTFQVAADAARDLGSERDRTYLLVDPSFAVGTRSYDGSRPRRQAHLHYLGAALVLWVGWLAAIGIGVTAGATLPPELRLESVGPLYLVALVVTSARTAAARVGVAVAVVTAVVASLLPLHLGPAVGMVAGLLAGSLVQRRPS